ncbi:ABC transporter permease [Mycoplasmopsis gallinarum]|uniref:Oligopeptide transport system permease protein n=1 Tax=Mycoplasmopsis gallinarum TaxID=29557 RepID=A0A168RK71_9BACT|nr:ABC transporter permease [Mycoplasmopsis gallinarum]OAB49059.1 Oligopeptide transport system permease protein [Mycoplasmopsis gallinarum]
MFRILNQINKNKVFQQLKPYLKLINKILLSFVTVICIVTFLYILLSAFFPITNAQRQSLNNAGANYDEIYANIVKTNLLNKPLIYRVSIYLRNIFQLNFGEFSQVSDLYGISNTNIFDYFIVQNKYTYLIGFISLIISLILGFYLGYLSGKHKQKLIDYGLNLTAIIFLSISLLVLIPVIILIFSSFGFIIKFNNNNFLTYLLPIFSLILITIAPIMQIIRAKTIEISETEFFIFYKAMGFSQNQIFYKLFFPNLVAELMNLLPFLTIGIFISSIFLEIYFAIPGTWKYLYNVITSHENKASCFLVLWLGTIYSFTYVIGELVKFMLNPQSIKVDNE